jgi:hypothetical protein
MPLRSATDTQIVIWSQSNYLSIGFTLYKQIVKIISAMDRFITTLSTPIVASCVYYQ